MSIPVPKTPLGGHSQVGIHSPALPLSCLGESSTGNHWPEGCQLAEVIMECPSRSKSLTRTLLREPFADASSVVIYFNSDSTLTHLHHLGFPVHHACS